MDASAARGRSLALSDIGEEVRDTIRPVPGRTYELFSVPAFSTGAPEEADGAQIGSSKRIVQTGDVLICKINPRINRVWEVGPPANGLPQVASTEYLVLRLNDGSLRRWLVWYLRSPAFRRWITRNVEGATGSHTRAKSPSIMRQLIPLGSADQRAGLISQIEMQTSRISAADQALRAALTKIAGYKRQLLAMTFSETEQRWPTVKLAVLVRRGPQNGLYVPESHYGGGVPILRIDDFQMGSSKSVTELQRVKVSAEVASRYLLRAGDIVINRVNSPSHLGKALAVEERNLPALFESNMMRIRLSAEVDVRFVELYLRSPGGRGRLIRNAKWAVNQASINQADVLGTDIPVPPRQEQAHIADTLDAMLSGADQLGDALRTAMNRVPSLRNQVLGSVFGA